MAKELDNKKMWESILIKIDKSPYDTVHAYQIHNALKDQGFKFDGENIVPIEPEFKIEAGKWYMCIKDMKSVGGSKCYEEGKCYHSEEEGHITSKDGLNLLQEEVASEYFRPVTEEEIAVSGQNENQIGGQKGGQKPKFKEGDWVVWDGFYHLIEGISSEGYICEKGKIAFEVEKDLHLWSIADTKDGDVLYLQKDGKEHIIIYKGVIKERFRTFVSAYCAYNGIVEDFCFADVSRYIDIAYRGIMPATKEQCDLLFVKMKEAGYEWDAEHKQLKKIEQKPEYPLAHEKMETERWKEACKAACSDINYRSHYGLTETRDDYFVDGVHWADEHPKQKQWKPTKEQLLAIDTAINVVGKNTLSGDALIGLLEQLKAL